jgi:hypothetical protein
MSWSRQRKPSRMAQAVAILALLLTVPLGIDYMRQSSLKRDWQTAAERTGSDLATAVSASATFEARKAFVQTDAYIEQAARSQLKFAYPGETLVVVSTGATPMAEELPEPAVTPERAPASWLERLLGR